MSRGMTERISLDREAAESIYIKQIKEGIDKLKIKNEEIEQKVLYWIGRE